MPNQVNHHGNQCWYNEQGFHREDDLPALIRPNGTKIWYINGKIHRENGPAVIRLNGNNKYYLNDIEYTEDTYRTIQFFNGITFD
jgi:hypothetical protein